MTTMTPCAADDPRYLAWKAYTTTDDYANNLRWASKPMVPAHVDGALWGAFLAGYESRNDELNRLAAMVGRFSELAAQLVRVPAAIAKAAERGINGLR